MPSKKKVTYGPTVKERAKRLLEALLDYVNWELEDVGGISVDHRWQDETTAQPKLVIKTELRTLEFLTTKDKHEGKLTTTQIRQALNQHLKDFLEILEDNRLKTQGKEELHFTLTLWSKKDKQKNLEQFEIKWESLRPEKSKQQEETLRETVAGKTPKPKEETINWQEICRQNLALQKELTTNLFTNANGMTPQLDGVYVPLAIVERQKPKPQPRNQQEEKEKETEKLIPIAEERFFEDVLRQGKSDISQGRKIAIIGEPGAGKTTRLQKIADWILEQDLGLPIWIDLAELGEQNICEYLEKVWLSRCRGEVTRGDLEAQMSRVWLLLDGVDEMTHSQGMQQLAKDLLRSWVQAARVVVTCRVNVWEADQNAFSGFDVFRNLEFNAEQVTEYIRRWFAGMGDAATGESLEAKLAESENSRLKELIQNPLRLWMLCQIWSSRQGTLPDTQAKLYASFIKYIYRWKEQFIKTYAQLCGKTQSECQKLLHEALGELAKAAIDGKSSRFRLSYRLVSEYLGDRSDETSLLSLALSLGWLNRVGIDFDEPEESVYGFYHATFQEYFAALAVEDWDYFLPRNHVDFPVVGKEYRIFEAQWKQVILLWLGLEEVGKNEKEKFIEKLVNFDDGCGKWNFEEVNRGFYEYQAYLITPVGINEFKACTIADVIVAQVVQWGFGYLNIETQKRINFVDLIQGYAKQILPKMDYPRVVTKLIRILDNTEDKDIHWTVALILGKIAPGNEKAISYFITILQENVNPYTKDSAVKVLGEIGGENAKAIDALISFLEIPRCGFTRLGVVEALEKLEPNNQKILDILNELLFCNNEKVILKAAKKLLKLNPGETRIIKILIQLLQTSINRPVPKLGKGFYLYDATPQEVISTFKSIAIKNKEIITSLISILETTKDENICRVISEVICILKSIENEDTFSNVVDISAETWFRNKEAERERDIAALIALLSTTNSGYTRMTGAESLGKIATGNPEAIAALIELLSTTNDVFTRLKAAENLHKIDPGNPEAIAALIELLSTTNDVFTRRTVAESLGKIDPGNPEAIAALIRILSATTDEDTRRTVVYILNKIVQNDQIPSVVSALQHFLSDTTYETNYDLYERCFEILWNCAQNLPYPTFYQAWHHQLTTPHPEVPETTGVGSTPFTQSLNLADLPKILDARLIETQLIESLQLICIDTSKFIDSDNPALDIYEQFLDQNCPQRPNSEPETLAQLKFYWNQLRRDSDKHPILIFYQDPTSPAAQGLSPTFLNALTRFDGTICLITDTPHPPLQTFSPHDPDLLQTVVNWLKRVHFES
ncbi:HEAT repeat domain-containing protein [Microcoleus sp.]|uniref:NACHT C-terminal alpha/beta 1 domain-containing protein n=1 Tax=Microcoleus sp. TaxID=44472 RepID=UPI00352409FE